MQCSVVLVCNRRKEIRCDPLFATCFVAQTFGVNVVIFTSLTITFILNDICPTVIIIYIKRHIPLIHLTMSSYSDRATFVSLQLYAFSKYSRTTREWDMRVKYIKVSTRALRRRSIQKVSCARTTCRNTPNRQFHARPNWRSSAEHRRRRSHAST